MSRVIFLAPLALFLVIAIYFTAGLKREPSFLPSMLIDQPTPQFSLPPIEDFEQGLSTKDLNGKVSLINIFGSWCVACQVEHPLLMKIKADGGPPIYGIDWNDKPGAGTAWLQRFGNPYERVGDDADGRVAIEFGVTGAPETYLIDKMGRIRHKHIGPITEDDWRDLFVPMIKELENEHQAVARDVVPDGSDT